MTYYNEFDPFPAQWLRNLIAAGHLPEGEVDQRSIEEVEPDEPGETAHFFAGIGGWPLALRMAGWPDSRPVWTASCPCQPFSAAGRRAGTADKRHLWPVLFKLIAERRPPVVFGEQVASRLGREWLAGVRADLEGVGYRFGAADLCAAGVGAPHIRQRLFWVADTELHGRHPSERGEVERSATARVKGGMLEPQGLHPPVRLADTDKARPQGRLLPGTTGQRLGDGERTPWSDSTFLACSDGKQRRIPTQPELYPLAHGLPGGVGRLRAYGNAIVPQVAATFITAYVRL